MRPDGFISALRDLRVLPAALTLMVLSPNGCGTPSGGASRASLAGSPTKALSLVEVPIDARSDGGLKLPFAGFSLPWDTSCWRVTVLAVQDSEGLPAGSAIAVGPHVMATAAHVVDWSQDTQVFTYGGCRRVARCVPHPGWDFRNLQDDSDLALCTFHPSPACPPTCRDGKTFCAPEYVSTTAALVEAQDSLVLMGASGGRSGGPLQIGGVVERATSADLVKVNTGRNSVITGNSGGPVFSDENGRVAVGVIAGAMSDSCSGTSTACVPVYSSPGAKRLLRLWQGVSDPGTCICGLGCATALCIADSRRRCQAP